MPQIHLREPGFTKKKERIQKFKKIRGFTIYLSKQTR